MCAPIRPLALLALLTSACSSFPPSDVDPSPRPVTSSPSKPRPPARAVGLRAPVRFAAASRDGLAVIDAERGVVLASIDADVVDDLLLDRPRGRLLTFEHPARDAEDGALIARDLGHDGETPTLSAPRTVRHLDGRARHLALDAGVIAFEDAYGARARLVDDAGGTTQGLAGPLPKAAWIEPGGARVTALLREADDGWWLATFTPRAGALTTTRTPIAPPRAETARALRLGDGRVVLLDVEGGGLTTRVAGGETTMAITAFSHADEGVVDACPLAIDRAVVLTSEGRLALIEIAPSGRARGLAVVDAVELGLPSGARIEPTASPPRRLLVLGAARVLVGTDDAVRAFDVAATPTGAHLVRDRAFRSDGARAPIDGPLP
jgi:hypothetical protein